MVQLDPSPTFAVATMVESDELAQMVHSVDSPFSGTLHIAEPVLSHLCLW
jgi:hypothetical protein